MESAAEEEEGQGEPAAKRGRVEAGEVEVDRALLSAFMSRLNTLFGSDMQLPMSEVVRAMAEEKLCTPEQAHACVAAMTDQNKVMLSGEVLYRI